MGPIIIHRMPKNFEELDALLKKVYEQGKVDGRAEVKYTYYYPSWGWHYEPYSVTTSASTNGATSPTITLNSANVTIPNDFYTEGEITATINLTQQLEDFWTDK